MLLLFPFRVSLSDLLAPFDFPLFDQVTTGLALRSDGKRSSRSI
jgi:hypothetical protein